jgi:hypothetical protein
MKQTLTLVFIAAMILALGCTKDTVAGTDTDTKGIVKGRVTDTRGNGLPNVQVVIEHTVLYAKYVYATTDANGYYKTNVPEGSWRASVQIQKQFLDKTYNFELSPDEPAEFNGTGAVRNFTWKLSGAKPYGGYYGSNVAVYNEPGYALEMTDVEIKLTPNGPLVDGSAGGVITSKLTDIGGGEDGIRDVPIGMYVISARNTATGQPLEIRLRNTGTYGSTVTSIFNSGFTGMNTYQIVVQVK